ncbi:T9SS C-terminal target domain-containing protein [candidate division KSB1 bacterium]|nr:T9SS type A sorting domain-containing protein [candidate division KSB1 bacterium]RQW01148.1 MAG: T9SS C-terminal target domain-containing protein [candidate division KSB1 bacterium]
MHKMLKIKVLVLVLFIPLALLAQYLEPEFPPTLQLGPFPFGTEQVRGDAPVDVADPNEVIHEYTAYKGTVTVDGDLSDSAWVAIPWTLMEFNRDIPTSAEGSLWSEDYTPTNWYDWEDMTTWFKMIHDDDNIYVALLRYDDENSWVEGTDIDDGNIWQNDAYQLIVDTRYPFDFEEESPGAEIGVCLVDGLEVYHWWSTTYQNPPEQLELADGDCSSGVTSTDGKAIRGTQGETASGYKETLEMAFLKYDVISDDMLGMFTICALDRDFDVHESVNQWAQGLFVKTNDEYGSVLWSAQSVPTAVENRIAKPNSFILAQNYPNPFNPLTTISYSLNKMGHVLLTVYSLDGREIATLIDESQVAGGHSITFDASQLSSGIYLYQLQTADQKLTRKMTLLR